MSLEQIKQLREKTGAGIVEVKKALDEAAGDEVKAMEILRKRGQEKADKKAERSVAEGVIAAYIHSNGKVGTLVKLNCETDFVARNEEFKELARDIAMHITAVNPQDKAELLTQPFIKNPEVTVETYVAEKIGKIGENIQVGEFSRFEL